MQLLAKHWRIIAKALRFLQNPNLDLAEAPAGFPIFLDEPGQLDGAGQPGRASAYEYDVHRYGFFSRRLLDDKLLHRKSGLVLGGYDLLSGHVFCPLAVYPKTKITNAKTQRRQADEDAEREEKKPVVFQPPRSFFASLRSLR